MTHTQEFIAHMKTDVFTEDARRHLIVLGEEGEVFVTMSLHGGDPIMRAALELDYLSPEDAEYWRTVPFESGDPIGSEQTERRIQFNKKYLELAVVSPGIVQERAEVQLLINKHDGTGHPIIFFGVITQLTNLMSVL